MGIGSGLGGSVGIAPETVYGTYVAPTLFPEVNKYGVKKSKKTAQGGGIAAGRMVQPGSRRVMVGEAAAGPVELEVTNKKMGLLLQHIFGGAAAPVQQMATAAYLQTHVLADTFGKSLTMQGGMPDTTGTVRPYTVKGCKVVSAEFSCSAGGLFTVSLDIDGQKVSEVETIAAPSYVTGVRPYSFKDSAIKLGTFASEAAVSGVKGMTLKLERSMAVDRDYASAAGLKAEPIMNDWVKISGSFDVDFVDKTVFADRFASDGSTSLVWEFLGPIIASTYAETFRLKAPQIFLEDGAPVLDGPGILSGAVPFTGQYDLTNAPITCEYMSVDTTI